jgi:hypothetical protein
MQVIGRDMILDLYCGRDVYCFLCVLVTVQCNENGLLVSEIQVSVEVFLGFIYRQGLRNYCYGNID